VGGVARDSAELLTTAPGVTLQDSGGWGQSKSLVVRGASSTGTLVLLDGIPLNGAGGIADVSRVPLAIAERFEVLRGGAGARYGSGGLGGVVNVVTRSPGRHLRVAGEATYGSWGHGAGLAVRLGPARGRRGPAARAWGAPPAGASPSFLIQAPRCPETRSWSARAPIMMRAGWGAC
jgi:iron complex outermembrane receptor protein